MLRILLFVFLAAQVSSQRVPFSTIESSDGDIIDCFNVLDQPAFDNPVLKNHQIPEIPAWLNRNDQEKVRQVWNQFGSCPDDTVPIRRNTHTNNITKRWPNKAREYAAAYPTNPVKAYGTQATINIWEPTVEPGSGEFSLAQMWLIAGDYYGDLNTVEAGWQVFPDHYNDSQPRLFISWTRDTYQDTGCLNLDCPGFVVVPDDYAIGAAFLPTSVYGGNQYDVKMTIWKDPEDGNWWLGIGQLFVGYWPSKLFTHLENSPATVVQWGGEVVNTQIFSRHTRTQMGSGRFAEEGFSKASYFREMRIIDHFYRLQPIEEFLLETENSTCYNAMKVHNEQWGTHFYFGGPGYNTLCP